MTTDVRTATVAFINLFDKSEPEKNECDEFIVESDHETILHNLNFAEKMFPQNAIMLCPRSHPGFKYMSSNCERVLGHTHKSLMSMDLHEFFALVHPEDLSAVRQCLGFISNCQPLDPSLHRFTMQYRFRDSEGNYFHVRDEKIALKTIHGNYLYFMLFSNVSDDEKFYQVKLEIHKNMNGNFIRMYSYNPRQNESNMTPRQNDIARLILKGFSNQEIADRLSVSVFTVKNHKRSLFKKVNVKNSLELTNFVKGQPS